MRKWKISKRRSSPNMRARAIPITARRGCGTTASSIRSTHGACWRSAWRQPPARPSPTRASASSGCERRALDIREKGPDDARKDGPDEAQKVQYERQHEPGPLLILRHFDQGHDIGDEERDPGSSQEHPAGDEQGKVPWGPVSMWGC